MWTRYNKGLAVGRKEENILNLKLAEKLLPLCCISYFKENIDISSKATFFGDFFSKIWEFLPASEHVSSVYPTATITQQKEFWVNMASGGVEKQETNPED